MFGRLGRFVACHPWYVVLLWLVIGALAYGMAPAFEDRAQDDDIHLLPARCLSVQGLEILQRAFPKEVFASKLILACERTEGPLTAADLACVDQLTQALKQAAQDEPESVLGAVTSHRDPLIGPRLVSDDRRCTLVMASVETSFTAMRTAEFVNDVEERVQSILKARPAGLQVSFTGPAAIGRDLNDAAFRSLEHTTWATFLLVVVVLLLIYRAPILACIPLCTIAASVWLSLRVLALLTLLPNVQLVNVTRIFVVVVLYGAGTDYCLFLVSRYREELKRGAHPTHAIALAIERVGGALCASAATIVVGLGLMGCAEFAKLRYVGPAVALCLIIALVASLTLTPALLALLGRWAFWPWPCVVAKPTSMPSATHSARLWHGFSAWVTRRPLAVWSMSILLLLPLAWVGYRTEFVFAITAELPRDAQSRYGMEVIQKHFTAGEIGPLTVLLEGGHDWDSPAGRNHVSKLTRVLAALPNVAEVRSLTQPLGRTVLPDYAKIFAHGAVTGYYVAKIDPQPVTRLDVILQSDPFVKQSVDTMLAVKTLVEQEVKGSGGRYALYGVTPLTYDIADVHHVDRLRINVLVMGGIYLILLGIVRRPIFAAYLLASVLLTYYVTIGTTQLLSHLWLGSAIGKIDWKVPFFLFTILVAIGEDYNIFLMTRVLEEAKRHGLRVGTRLALAQTGGTITSCGLIMAGTFATLMLCPLATLAQLGVALAFGVLLDTFVVRTVLVPAFLLLIDRPQRPAVVEPIAGTIPMPSPLRKSA